MYIIFITPGHAWHPAPFPIQVPLAPHLSQGIVAKAIISFCKGNWNHLLLWAFLYSHYLNMTCVAEAQESCLWFWCWHLLFRTIWWKHSMATMNAKLCSLDMMAKDEYSSSVLSGKCATQHTLLSFCRKNFRADLSNKTIVRGNWCTKTYTVLGQGIMRIFCAGTVAIRTSQYFLPFRRSTDVPSVWMQQPVTTGRYRLWTSLHRCPFSPALHHGKAHLWQLCTLSESVISSLLSWDAQINFVFSSSLSCQIQLCSLVELKGLVVMTG